MVLFKQIRTTTTITTTTLLFDFRTGLLAGGQMICPRRASLGLDIPTSQRNSQTLDVIHIPDKGTEA